MVVAEERCVDTPSSNDRVTGLLNPFLANGIGPGVAGVCWLPQGAQLLGLSGPTP